MGNSSVITEHDFTSKGSKAATAGDAKRSSRIYKALQTCHGQGSGALSFSDWECWDQELRQARDEYVQSSAFLSLVVERLDGKAMDLWRHSGVEVRQKLLEKASKVDDHCRTCVHYAAMYG